MGRSPCSSEERLNRGPWTAQEDMALCEYIRIHGHGRWRNVAQKAGLKRSGKSCRLRWLNYLRPDIKRGGISVDEEELIIRLHRLLGNRWSLIAGRLPGRTDNEIKNHWNTALHKKVAMYEFQPRRSPESPSPTQIQNQHVLKPIPLKITTAVTPNRCNGDGTNEGFNWSNVKETMRTSKLCTDFLLNDSVAYEESDRIASASKTLEHCRNPTCSMSSLVDHFGGEAVTLDEILMGFNELSSRDWILLSSDPSPSSEDLRFVESYTGPWIHELIDDNMKQVIEGVTLDFP